MKMLNHKIDRTSRIYLQQKKKKVYVLISADRISVYNQLQH